MFVLDYNFIDFVLYGNDRYDVIQYKIYEKCKNRSELFQVYHLQSWTKYCKQIHKIKQSRVFLWMILQQIFRKFLAQLSKLGFREAGCGLATNSNLFRDTANLLQRCYNKYPKISGRFTKLRTPPLIMMLMLLINVTPWKIVLRRLISDPQGQKLNHHLNHGPCNYNTNTNNMSENPFLKVYWIRYTSEEECNSL